MYQTLQLQINGCGGGSKQSSRGFCVDAAYNTAGVTTAKRAETAKAAASARAIKM
jgi:hypothetical protein